MYTSFFGKKWLCFSGMWMCIIIVCIFHQPLVVKHVVLQFFIEVSKSLTALALDQKGSW